jgi:aminodeoxyfutalosine synthase
MAGSRAPDALTRAELVRLIRAAGRVPVERDTLYNVVAEGAALDAVLSTKQRKSLEVLA